MHQRLLAAIVLTALLGGCETNPPQPAPSPPSAPAATPPPSPPPPPPEPPKPVPPAKSGADLAMEQGIALYESGNFNGAIKTLLDAKEIWSGTPQVKVAAHKYIAFSYCVTRRLTLCRQQFSEALKIDPTFVLEPAEKSHPIWGPQFDAAKKAAAAPVPRKPAAPAKPAPAKSAPATTKPS